MSVLKGVFIGVLVLPAAELAVFILLVLAIGWLWTAALIVGTSLLGVMVLRRAAPGQIQRLRLAIMKDGPAALHLETPGVGPTVGAILLVLPGFITTIVGALLFVPQIRRWGRKMIGRAFQKPHGQQRPAVVDLEPEEWRQVPNSTIEDTRGRDSRA
jgi:UPF0716 protein FxsA